MTYKLMIAGLCATGLAADAWAHSGAMGVVKERMDAMKAMGDAVKRIKPMMSGEAVYDAAAVQAAARVIAEEAGAAMTGKFPEGSGGGVSEALPAVWSDRARFAALARDLEVTARGLEHAAQNGTHGAGHMSGDLSGMMGDTSGMMGRGMMGTDHMSGAMSVEHIGQMQADGAFVMMTQVCSACHDRFREEK
jgi:cytochrome c556